MGKNTNKVSVILEDLDEKDITSILNKWREVAEIKSQIGEIDIMLRAKIRAYLKERHWSKYKDDESDISVSISSYKTESVDKKQLKMMLNDSQYAQVMQTKTTERLTIVTPEARERLKKQFAKGGK